MGPGDCGSCRDNPVAALLLFRPARHSVTPRCWLALLSLSRLNLQMWVIVLTFLASKDQDGTKVASLQAVGAQFRTKCWDCMGLTDRPLCTTNFNHFIIVYVRMGGYRCYAGTTPRRRCTHVHINAKDKLRPFTTNSAFCGGFESWTVCLKLML
jgi:hypothetical protein